MERTTAKIKVGDVLDDMLENCVKVWTTTSRGYNDCSRFKLMAHDVYIFQHLNDRARGGCMVKYIGDGVFDERVRGGGVNSDKKYNSGGHYFIITRAIGQEEFEEAEKLMEECHIPRNRERFPDTISFPLQEISIEDILRVFEIGA